MNMDMEYSNSPERQRRELMIRMACEFRKGTLQDTIIVESIIGRRLKLMKVTKR